MTEGHLDADRFAALAHGADHLSAGEAVHLAECPECRAERDMIVSAGRLGFAALQGFDPARVTAAVLDRRPAARRFPGSRRHWLIGLAAAAVLVIAVWRAGGGPAGGSLPPSQAAPPMVLHELDNLTAAQLEVVFRELPPETGTASLIEDVPLGELTADDLERVLQSMEE